MVLIYFLCYFSGSSSFITVKISGMYLFFLRTKKRSWSCSFSTDWGLEHSRAARCSLVGTSGRRPYGLPLPSLPVLLLPDLPKGMLDAAGPLPPRETLWQVHWKRGFFQPGLAPVSFQNVRCFFLFRTFREKGNNLTSAKGFVEEGDSVSERKMGQEASKVPWLVVQS